MAVNLDYVKFHRKLFLNALQTRLLNSNFEKVPTVGYPPPTPPPPAPSPRTSDKCAPLRDFAPPKLKVFRRAWWHPSTFFNVCLFCNVPSWLYVPFVIVCSVWSSAAYSSIMVYIYITDWSKIDSGIGGIAPLGIFSSIFYHSEL